MVGKCTSQVQTGYRSEKLEMDYKISKNFGVEEFVKYFDRCFATISSQFEMKFDNICVSEYFTFAKQRFHSEAISLARRANFVKKSTCLRKCFFWLGMKDLNPHKQSQSLSCGHYTNPQLLNG